MEILGDMRARLYKQWTARQNWLSASFAAQSIVIALLYIFLHYCIQHALTFTSAQQWYL